jgi:hypothetical protein
MEDYRCLSQWARQRILSDDELRALWKAEIPQSWGGLVRFLLLTAARRNHDGTARMLALEIFRGLDGERLEVAVSTRRTVN